MLALTEGTTIMSIIDKRLTELERHAYSADQADIRFIRFVGLGQEHLPIARAVCGGLQITRASGETDEQFDTRVKTEVEEAYPDRRGPHLVFTYSRAETEPA
jgi:hypothetical protein